VKKFIWILLISAACVVGNIVSEPEVITSFASDITVRQDATMRVEETIFYKNYGVAGLHGIYRDFPTRYKDRWGNTINVGFHVEQVLRNGSPVPYRVTSYANGKRVYIGDPDRIAPPGDYIYTIVYTTDRQLGFFKDHDELYWNMTGNGWKFPIMQARARVSLPEKISGEDIQIEAYTGYQGEQGQNYTAHVATNGVSEFRTTQPLAPGQGLTIVVSWPKGFVEEPSWYINMWYILRDNLGILWLLLGLIIILAFYVIKLHFFKKTQESWAGVVIPRFYPPQNLPPIMVRYIRMMQFDTTGFAAEVVNMAVHGLLTIHHKESGVLWKSAYYSLEQKTQFSQYDTEQDILHTNLQQQLFKKNTKLDITQLNHARVQAAIAYLKKYLRDWDTTYFNTNMNARAGGIILSLLFCGVAVFIIPQTLESALSYLLFAFYVLINIVFNSALQGYTKEGMRLYEEIEGFKLFLATTETERLKVVGTPPTKTPELYETYLPYAIALGVESLWSAQFAPIFARYEQEGHPYIPVWYVGSRPFRAYGVSGFAQNFSSAFSSAIASSAVPPGSSSGRGGRGSSGGGGGGGGGGSW
jgi:uncharacterized membrane protein